MTNLIPVLVLNLPPGDVLVLNLPPGDVLVLNLPPGDVLVLNLPPGDVLVLNLPPGDVLVLNLHPGDVSLRCCHADRLVGPVVKASASKAADLGSIPAFTMGSFPGWSQTGTYQWAPLPDARS